MSDNTIKSWIEKRRAALAHVLKHPHPDPAAEWAQTALDALNAVLELHQPFEWSFGYGPVYSCAECSRFSDNESDSEWPCATVRAIEGAIND